MNDEGEYVSVNVEDLPPCVTEDSMNCYWNAAYHGNGQGQSFVAIDGFVIYYPSADLPVPEGMERALPESFTYQSVPGINFTEIPVREPVTTDPTGMALTLVSMALVVATMIVLAFARRER